MTTPSQYPTPDRREFLQKGTAVVAAPWIISASALGLGTTVPPSDRIVMGAIGCGGKGRHNTRQFLNDPRVQWVAVCDVDAQHRAQGKQDVDQHLGNSDCTEYSDHRALLQHPDLDAVHVSTPDHWHAVASVDAMRAGLDVYCEKPLANSFGESKAIRDTAAATGRVLQCGSHERSNARCRLAAEIVRNGRLGEIREVRIQMPCEQEHHLQARNTASVAANQTVPAHLDWNTWQGPTGPVPYAAERCHFWWRFVLAYGGGEMTDRGAHIIDIAQLALGMDDCGPVLFEAKGQQIEGSPYDAFWDYSFTNTYANGVQLIGSTEGPRGLKILGSDGWLFVAIHGGELTASDPSVIPEGDPQAGTPAEFQIGLGRSPDHHRNFIDCVLDRSAPMASAEVGHRTATICHLNNIAMRMGRPIRWDPCREELVGDVEAGGWLMPEMRQPWVV